MNDIALVVLINRPVKINGKNIDRWFSKYGCSNCFWQKKEYAIEHFAEKGLKAS